MFKKLLSNLPYNPSLIGQVSFYAKRVHAEESVRRLGFIFIVLSLFVQMTAVFNTPQPSLAQSNNDIIPGGFASKESAINHCTADNYQFGTILSYFGITCTDLSNSTTQTIRSTDYDGKLLSLGRNPSSIPGEKKIVIDGVTYYQRHLKGFDSGNYSPYKALVGATSSGMTFMVLYVCGNPVVLETDEPEVRPEPAPVLTPFTRPEHPAPVHNEVPGHAACSRLEATSLSRTRVRFTAYTEGERYKVVKYKFDYGDGETRTYSSKRTSMSRTHYYDPGTYQAVATAYFEVVNELGEYASAAHSCTASVTVHPRPAPTQESPDDECPLVPGIQTDKDDCDVCPEIPGNQSTESECKPCDASSTLEDIEACLTLSKTARNNTQNIKDANGTVASGGDEITYTLTTINNGRIAIENHVIQENVADVLEYATLTDLDGGELGQDNIIRWPAEDLRPGETEAKKITFKVMDPIPQTPVSISHPASFDLTMTNVYGNTVNISLPPTAIKTTEKYVSQLPNTGPAESLLAVVSITIFAGYLFARSRLFAKELDIVKTDFASTGGA